MSVGLIGRSSYPTSEDPRDTGLKILVTVPGRWLSPLWSTACGTTPPRVRRGAPGALEYLGGQGVLS